MSDAEDDGTVTPAADRAIPATRAADAGRGLLAPSALRPLELDLRAVFWVVTGLWAVALAVVAVLAAVRDVEGRTVAVCAAGFVLGFVALAWERWHAASERRRAGPGPDA